MGDESEQLSAQQLKNLKYTLKKQHAEGPCNVEEVKEWCEARAIPQDLASLDPHQILVPDYLAVNAESLYIFLTTKHLVETSSKASCIQTDATYDTNAHGFPCIVTGSLDANHKFHVTGLHIVWKTECIEVYESVGYSFVILPHNMIMV